MYANGGFIPTTPYELGPKRPPAPSPPRPPPQKKPPALPGLPPPPGVLPGCKDAAFGDRVAFAPWSANFTLRCGPGEEIQVGCGFYGLPNGQACDGSSAFSAQDQALLTSAQGQCDHKGNCTITAGACGQAQGCLAASERCCAASGCSAAKACTHFSAADWVDSCALTPQPQAVVRYRCVPMPTPAGAGCGTDAYFKVGLQESVSAKCPRGSTIAQVFKASFGNNCAGCYASAEEVQG